MNERSPAVQGCSRAGLLPSFFVIGPPRTGTSWIHEVLRRRASLPDPVKETRFFDLHFDRGLDWYFRQFAQNDDSTLPRGEIAPTYFASTEARRRIATITPHVKIVCIFRDPVERMFSLYRVKRAYGMVRCGFAEALLRDNELLESAKYASHLKQWRASLGEDQVLPMLYDNLRNDPQQFINSLTEFLGIERFTLASKEMRHVHGSDVLTHPRIYRLTHAGSGIAQWLKTRGFGQVAAKLRHSSVGNFLLGSGQPFEALPADLARMAYELVRDEVEQLEPMLNCDLSAWKPRARKAHPSPAPA